MKARCIEKVRDKNNRVIGYTLIDQSGNKLNIKSDALKNAIRNNKVEVINLTLTSDNRLISGKEKKGQDEIRTILNRAISLGFSVKQFKTGCKHACYILSKEDKHMLIIPDDVTEFYADGIYKHMTNLTGSLKVIGGKNLIDASRMFRGCEAQLLDLSSFDTSNVADMSWMFADCKAQSINLSSFDTRNVTNMYSMFADCEAQSLDLSSFDTSKVTDMSRMFIDCKAQSINLSSFDTSKVIDMTGMFYKCEAQSINLSSFDTSKVTNMKSMFKGCKVQSLDLSSFDMNNVKDMKEMFFYVDIGELILNTSTYNRLKSLLKNMKCNIVVS